MTTTHYAEPVYPGAFLAAEGDLDYSRDRVTLAAGNNLQIGAVLARIVAVGTAAAVAAPSNAGNGTLGTITIGADAQPGTYRALITSSVAGVGEFTVFDPQGDIIGIGNLGTAFNGGGLGFILAPGTVDFAPGDSFTIGVVIASEKWTAVNPTAVDGRQIAAGILYEATDASLADTPALVIARKARVKRSGLTWLAGTTQSQQDTALAQLAAAGILATP